MSVEDRIICALNDCETDLQPRSGDCGNIATAIGSVLEDATIVGFFDTQDRDKILHFAVRINGELYDGAGKTNAKELSKIFVEENLENPSSQLREVESVGSTGYIVFPELVDRIRSSLEKYF